MATPMTSEKDGTAPKPTGCSRTVLGWCVGLGLGALAGIVAGLVVGVGLAMILGVL
jgi:hypothetical protein